MTVEFDGRERTVSQLRPYLENNDRAVREQAWRLGAERFLKDKDALSELYLKMVGLRDRVGRNAGFDDYRAYSFRAKRRFDYTPQDCLTFHQAIENVVVPAVSKLADRRRGKLGVESIRPWDLDVDPDGLPPLRPFESEAELTAGCSAIFNKVHPDFGRIFDTLASRQMLDLDNRRAKAPGGYQETYDEQRMPFIFMNAVGTADDVQTLLHEGGHAFHTWACRNDPLLEYRRYPIEFAEVASMGMECLAMPHLEGFFGDQADRARRRHLADVLSMLPWIARVDAMQHHVYTHVQAGLDNWTDHWRTLTRRFAPHQDWSGLEAADRYSWQRKLHFYQVPFYYIEYAIAQLGALQVWLNSRRDYQAAVADYQAALTLGGARPLPELFETAGCKFDFTERTVAPLVEAVMAEVE
jgi:oligoendopeptidase F